MPLTAKQQDFIISMDANAKHIVQQGGEEALLMSLAHHMHHIKDLMDSTSEEELNHFCQRYDGFYQYMQLLERMALASSQGAFDDITI